MLDLNDRAVSERLEDLRQMGLTRPEAVVYAVLVSLGPCHARKLYGPAGHTREETYRILRSLESKGFVQIRMEKPLTFVAIEPEVAVKTFASHIEEEAAFRKKQAEELGTWLREIRGGDVETAPAEKYHFKLLHGHQIMKQGFMMECRSKSTYAFITSAPWLPKMEEVGNFEPLLQASRRGVRVRIMTEVNECNLAFVKKYRKNFEIRHQPDAANVVGLVLCDDSEMMLGLGGNGENIDGLVVLSSDSVPMIEEFKFIYETLWNTAIPVTGLLPTQH